MENWKELKLLNCYWTYQSLLVKTGRFSKILLLLCYWSYQMGTSVKLWWLPRVTIYWTMITPNIWHQIAMKEKWIIDMTVDILSTSTLVLNRGSQWFLISNLMKQGLDLIKNNQKNLVSCFLVQNPSIARALKFSFLRLDFQHQNITESQK